jgi:hypothetical protein
MSSPPPHSHGDSTAPSASAVCTLFEGNYHYGVGALTNSLYQHGFRGVIWAGYRGDLPPWAHPLTPSQHGQDFDVAPGCLIRFVPLETKIFFSNYKPHFMLDLWSRYGVEAENLFYFDPDIVTKCRWSFFEEWVADGVALCLDGSYPHMSANHPLRKGWRTFADKMDYAVSASPNEYYNGGFVGVSREHAGFLEVWRELMNGLQRIEGINIESFKNFNGYNEIDRSHPFYVADQDALNLAVMITNPSLSVMGTEGMDFTGAGFTMAHAVDSPKPWQKNRLWLTFRYGHPAREWDREYLTYTDTPIPLYSPIKRFAKWVDYYTSRVLGSFFHRPGA